MLRWLTAGESHGPSLFAILEGMPAHVRVTTACAVSPTLSDDGMLSDTDATDAMVLTGAAMTSAMLPDFPSEVAVMVTLPMLVAGLLVGVLVSLFQTVTSIQDHVLAFLPRAAAIFAVFALTFPWMLRVMTGFTRQLIVRLPELVR